MKIAVITGASSGLGREYTLLADREGAFDEIWVIARRLDRLEQLGQECTTPLHPLSLDLGARESVGTLSHCLEDADCDARSATGDGLTIGLLVNAAGLAKFGTYRDLTQAEVDAMVDVNCRALVDVTQTALPYMHRKSRIIEIASSAAFQPLPGLGVYAASKSFVLSYTRSLRFELRGTGIHATAVCPYWIKTEFVQVARDTENGTTVKHPWPQLNPKRIVDWSNMVSKANYPVATCCVIGFIMRVFCKIIPAPIIMWIWEGIRRI